MQREAIKSEEASHDHSLRTDRTDSEVEEEMTMIIKN